MEHFFGDDLPRKQLEVLALRIDPAHRLETATVLGTRWFDYWNLHPVTATYLYAALYKAQTRIFNETYVDVETADDARAFTPDDIFVSRDLTSMWLAREAADKLGVPYEIALGFAGRRAVERTFQCFPRPNQLYDEGFEGDLRDYWADLCASTLQYSRAEHFAASRNDPAALPREVAAHVRHVIAQIQSRPGPHVGLLARMFKEDRLSPNWLLPFPVGEVVAAERLAFGLNK